MFRKFIFRLFGWKELRPGFKCHSHKCINYHYGCQLPGSIEIDDGECQDYGEDL